MSDEIQVELVVAMAIGMISLRSIDFEQSFVLHLQNLPLLVHLECSTDPFKILFLLDTLAPFSILNDG